MLSRINARLRAFRRRFSGTEWALKILGWPRFQEIDPAPGLLTIRIEGLSRSRLQAALREGRMPFIRSLVENEEVRLKRLDAAAAGVESAPGEAPSVLPASLCGAAENAGRGNLPGPFARAARRFAAVLARGADDAAANGAAAEKAGLTAAIGAPSAFRTENRMRRLCALPLYLPRLFRVLGYALLELALTAAESVRHAIPPRNLRPSVSSAFERLAVCAAMREVIRARAKLDVARGVRRVDANLAGYGIQARRRGPASRFALWTLQGIDSVIRDIQRTALNSGCRKYRLIVYSGRVEDLGGSGADRGGFALLPCRRRAQAAAVHWSGREIERPYRSGGPAGETLRRARPGFRLKVMTYNIHSCVNMVHRVDPEGIAAVIRRLDPDIAALQEVDAHKARTLFADQARRLAERLGMDHHFFPLVQNGSEKYGLAVLSRYPLDRIKCARLPDVDPRRPREFRGAMWLRLDLPEIALNLVNTHLGLQRSERFLQVKTLYGPEWLGSIPPEEALIFCGDLNAGMRSAVYRELAARLQDVQQMVRQPGYPRATFFSGCPLLRLDHIFVSRHLRALEVHVPHTQEARLASDHLPVVADLRVDDQR